MTTDTPGNQSQLFPPEVNIQELARQITTAGCFDISDAAKQLRVRIVSTFMSEQRPAQEALWMDLIGEATTIAQELAAPAGVRCDIVGLAMFDECKYSLAAPDITSTSIKAYVAATTMIMVAYCGFALCNYHAGKAEISRHTNGLVRRLMATVADSKLVKCDMSARENALYAGKFLKLLGL